MLFFEENSWKIIIRESAEASQTNPGDGARNAASKSGAEKFLVLDRERDRNKLNGTPKIPSVGHGGREISPRRRG